MVTSPSILRPAHQKPEPGAAADIATTPRAPPMLLARRNLGAPRRAPPALRATWWPPGASDTRQPVAVTEGHDECSPEGAQGDGADAGTSVTHQPGRKLAPVSRAHRPDRAGTMSRGAPGGVRPPPASRA